MDISSLSPSIREDLLLRNITSDTVEDNGLSGLLFNIGEFASIVNGTQNVRPSDNLEEIGDLYRDLLIINNRFQGELNDYQRISIVTNATEVSDGQPYNTSPEPANSPIIQNNELNKEFNALKNKYQGLLQNNTTISLVTYQPTEETFVNYDYSLADLGSSDESKGYRKNITTKNLYLDVESQILADIITTPIVTNKNLPNYAERMAGIVGGGASKNASTVIDNLLGGIVPNYSVSGTDPLFDVTSLLSGGRRTDTPETPLGIIAGDRLGFAIRQNAAFNLIEETIGNVNTNPISLLQGDSFIVPNYSITVAKGGGGAVLDFAERILGFQTPVSLLSTTSSIFSSENPVGNIERGNSMIENTGKGQVEALFFNLRQNLLSSNDMKSGYAPGFVDPRNPNGGIQGNANIYAFFKDGLVIDIENGPENNPISQSSYKLGGMVKGSGFPTLADKFLEVFSEDGSETIPFTWNDQTNLAGVDKKSILGKTQQLFNAGDKMKTMINKTFIQQDKSEVNSAVVDSEGVSYTSRGSNKVKFNGVIPETDPEKMFFRNFNSSRRYDRVNRLQKHSGILDNAGTNTRKNVEKSVLDDNGFVKIGPDSGDKYSYVMGDKPVKKYMFSIENLAWDGYSQNLIPEEIGNGDPISGKRGRIMWFPPYEMAFTDNTSVNWEKTDFIGRGEPIYTYNNTSRSGTLQFKIIIDHPSYLNSLKGESDALISSFFAGGFEVDDRVRSRLSANEIQAVEMAMNQEIRDENNTPQTEPESFEFYFPYGDSVLSSITFNGYEDGKITIPPFTPTDIDYNENPQGVNGGLGDYEDDDGTIRIDNTNYGLNKGKAEASFATTLSDAMYQCSACKVIITYYGVTGESEFTRTTRGSTVQRWFKNDIITYDGNDIGTDSKGNEVSVPRYEVKDGGEISVPLGSTTGTTIGPFTSPNPSSGNRNIKENAKVTIEFQWDAKIAELMNPNKVEPELEEIQFNLERGLKKTSWYQEAMYFKKLEQDNKFIYNSISEKIGYFHPAFHSITPEGFNSRLTFLQQCTRQGPTNFFTDAQGNDITNLNNVSNNNKGCNPDNLAFGKPPVCILRVGDFYHTKIVIDSLNYSFDPLVWDLNPEGVGVQPMICTVDINFAFIGGSSLSGPINRLQNAVSYNFFANTEVYSPQSDTVDKSELVRGEYPTTTIKDKGASPNTNPSTTNQVAQAAVAAGPTVPQPPPAGAQATSSATTTNPDVEIIKMASFKTPRWNGDGKMLFTFSDMIIIGDWSVKLQVPVDGQLIDIDVFPDILQSIDDDNNLILVSTLDKPSIDLYTKYMTWQNDATVEIPYFFVYLTFFQAASDSIRRYQQVLYAACADDEDGVEKYDLINAQFDEYEAGTIACRCKYDGVCPS